MTCIHSLLLDGQFRQNVTMQMRDRHGYAASVPDFNIVTGIHAFISFRVLKWHRSLRKEKGLSSTW